MLKIGWSLLPNLNESLSSMRRLNIEKCMKDIKYQKFEQRDGLWILIGLGEPSMSLEQKKKNNSKRNTPKINTILQN